MYRPDDPYQRYFGIGSSFNYGMFMYPVNQWQQVNLVLPDGGQVPYIRVSVGDGPSDGVYVNKTKPGQYFGSRVFPNPFGGWNLELTDGTIYQFTDFGFANANAVLTSIIDRNGNALNVTWNNSSKEITGITSPNGFWVQVSSSGEVVTKIQDDMGRTVSYCYTAGGCSGDPQCCAGDLSTVMNPNGAVPNYLYNSKGDLHTIIDGRGLGSQTDTYDTNERVTEQALGDGSAYKASYATDARGNVTAATVTDPNGNLRQIIFNADGYHTADTFAKGTSDQETYTFVRQAVTNQILSETDPMGRTTSYTHDADGNVASMTNLAGTARAQTFRYTYNAFSEPASVTDPLGNTTTYTDDANGNLIAKTDALGYRWTYTYNAKGELLTATDPRGHTTHYLRIGWSTGTMSSIVVVTIRMDCLWFAPRKDSPPGD